MNPNQTTPPQSPQPSAPTPAAEPETLHASQTLSPAAPPLHAAENTLDKILSTLNATAAPTHLQARIHARLAQHEHHPTPSRALRPAILIPALTLAAAALILALTHPRPPQAPARIPQPTQAALSSPPASTAPHTATQAPPSPLPNPPSRPTQPFESAFTPSLSPGATRAALNDTASPSFPAPPAPLTDQERLLLRAARHDSPTELAELEPLRQLAQSRAAETGQSSAIRQYIQHALAPLAFAERLNPTPAEPLPAPSPDQSYDQSHPEPASPETVQQ